MTMCMAINWQAVNFDWNNARAFLVTIQTGSLSAAARALGLTQPTLSRQVAALEQDLGVTLFERIGKSLAPTQSALELYEHVSAMGDAANLLSLTASGRSNEIEGTITITCTELTAAFKLPPIVKSLTQEHPGIVVDILASDESSDLKRREADIAIRAFRPTEPDLIAKKLYPLNVSLYATPEYLDSIHNPSSRDGFSQAQFIGFHQSNEDYIKALTEQQFKVDKSNFNVLCNNHSAHWEMTKLGVGIGVMPVEIADNETRVVRILKDHIIFEGEVWLVSHRELRTNRRVKTVFEFLSKALGEHYETMS